MSRALARRTFVAYLMAGLSCLVFPSKVPRMPARKSPKAPPIADEEITAVLEAMISWRYYLCQGYPDKDTVVLWHESREPHSTLQPTPEMVRRMHAEGWIRDSEAKGTAPHPLDFEHLYRYYVTTKGYQRYLASRGLI